MVAALLGGIMVNGVPRKVPRPKTLGACGTFSFGLETSLGTPFTMIPSAFQNNVPMSWLSRGPWHYNQQRQAYWLKWYYKKNVLHSFKIPNTGDQWISQCVVIIAQIQPQPPGNLTSTSRTDTPSTSRDLDKYHWFDLDLPGSPPRRVAPITLDLPGPQPQWVSPIRPQPPETHKEISLAPSTSQTKHAVQQGKVCWHGVLDCITTLTEQETRSKSLCRDLAPWVDQWKAWELIMWPCVATERP